MLVNNLAPVPLDPPIVIDAAYYARLEGLAMGAMQRAPELATRLLDEIERAEILPSGAVPETIVNIGSEVTFRDDAAGCIQTVKLVLPGDADISRHQISVLTPVGVALIGLSEGASIWWITPDNEVRELTVQKVQNHS
ncbi:nucleoside diphosphate kinase regulator [Thalassospira sp.]|uniref:nucleoside diphosphate kinase regulator n=1 Tax=Thalassospira sp. TaxID=1912094 RepID=UPI002734B64A|nr:nucleoside diphosphate kinase regulator [Thalassospira sp.]MDP2696808.1 nucleoside diphosphate kinase regulator [Thalassospira sp.]